MYPSWPSCQHSHVAMTCHAVLLIWNIWKYIICYIFPGTVQGDTVSEGIVNNQVENNTILIKERNVILTNDRWNIVVNVDFSAYQDALAKLKDDLHQINKFKSRFAPTSELSHVNNLVDLLGNQIDSFTQMLPRMDRRRGLVNVVGSVFKTLFGVATVIDLDQLHDSVNKLHDTQSDLVHSVNEQLTYLRSLDSLVKFNSKSVKSLSENVKSMMLNSQQWMNKVDATVYWLNVTLYNETSVFVYIRQLEFAILQLHTQIKDTLSGLDSTMGGKLSVNLIPPTLLQSVLRSIVAHLPDGYTLFTGIQLNDMYLYYECIDVTVFADHHNIRLLLTVPMKTFDRHFTLYRLVTLPHRVGNSRNFVQLMVDFPYLLIGDSKQRYLLYTQADVERCTGKSISVCPVDTQVYSTAVLTCELSLFFQKEEVRNLCARVVMSSNYPPKFTRHQQDWIYSISIEQRVELKCSKNNTWITTRIRIHGNGILRNASSCYIVGQNFQLYPTVHGRSAAAVTRDEQLVIQHVDPISLEEQRILLGGPTPDTSELDRISVDKMKMQSFDNILNIHGTNIQKSRQYYFYLYILIPSLVIVLCIVISCYGKPFWFPDVRRFVPCTKNLKNPNSPKLTPRTNPRLEVEPETSCVSDVQTGTETGKMQFVTYGAKSSD